MEIYEWQLTVTCGEQRAVSATESLWKAKLKAAQDDALVLQKRLGKAKLAADSAHESERHTLETSAVEKADLESQRDSVKEELWTAQAEITSLTAEVESIQQRHKKAKSKAKKTGVAASTEQEKLTARTEELETALEAESATLDRTRQTLKATELERDQAQARVVELVGNLDAATTDLRTTRDDLAAMTATRDGFKQKFETLSDTSNTASAGAAIAETRLSTEIESLKQFLSAAGTARDDAREDLRREREFHEAVSTPARVSACDLLHLNGREPRIAVHFFCDV